jgi:hypothetical protein
LTNPVKRKQRSRKPLEKTGKTCEAVSEGKKGNFEVAPDTYQGIEKCYNLNY